MGQEIRDSCDTAWSAQETYLGYKHLSGHLYQDWTRRGLKADPWAVPGTLPRHGKETRGEVSSKRGKERGSVRYKARGHRGVRTAATPG